jgi:hypothetical protein
MGFEGVDVPTVCRRPAIQRAYEANPPTDALLVGASQEGDRDTVTFSWSRGGAGAMDISWRHGLVQALVVRLGP